MKMKIENLLAASLLAGTALVPAAMAQQTQQQEPAAVGGQEVAGGQACVQLDQIIQNQGEQLGDDWTSAAERAMTEGTPEACEQYLSEAEQELGPEVWQQEQALFQEQGGAQASVDAAAEIEAEIAVRQEPPEVSVEQDAPEIAIDQAPPEVSVQQAQPRVTVRQPEPEVIVRMPDPEVIVNMPEPEITVEMPEPTVNVAQQQPQVEVSQDRPQVEVSQSQPQIAVDVAEDVQQAQQQGGEQAEVQLSQGQPQVQLEGAEQPQVQVEQAEPEVVYEAAEPVVRIERQGESQQAQQGADQQADQQLTAQQQEEEETGAAALVDVEAETETETEAGQMAQGGATWRGGRQAFNQPSMMVEGYEEAPATEISVDSLMGTNVYGENDNTIGAINDVVMGQDGQVEFVVVDVGGFLGLGARSVAIGLDEMQVMRAEGGGELRAYVNATQQELENAPEYQASN